MMTTHFVEFVRSFALILTILPAMWEANMIKHVSEIELYIITSTLEMFEHWN